MFWQDIINVNAKHPKPQINFNSICVLFALRLKNLLAVVLKRFWEFAPALMKFDSVIKINW